MDKFYTASELASKFCLSEPSFDRLVSQAYAGTSDFPLPLFGKGKKRVWSPQSIENWIASRQSQAVQKPEPPPKAESTASRAKRHAAACKSLKNLGVKIAEPTPSKKNDD